MIMDFVVGAFSIVFHVSGRRNTPSASRSSKWPALVGMAFVDIVLVEQPAVATKESEGS